MSKREGQSSESNIITGSKKPKLTGGNFQNPEMEKPAPEPKPNSPIPGPSNAPSDPELRASFHTDLVPSYRYFDPTSLQESSSQGSTSVTDCATISTTTINSTSTHVDVGESRTTIESIEEMDVDSEAATSESAPSTSNSSERHHYRYRKHRSRRDQ